MTSSHPDDIAAASRSKLSIANGVSIMVDIIRVFPMSHLPQLSPSALFCPYLASMQSQQLDRVNGVRSQPTLGGTDVSILVDSLKHFSDLWKCTSMSILSLPPETIVADFNCSAEYVEKIERGRARALPLPLSPTLSLSSTISLSPTRSLSPRF